MNREEAIDRLKGLFGNGYSKQEEALNMAIKALEQEPCEDAISREMALKECHDIVVDGERYRVIQEETLLGLPSVTPQPSISQPDIEAIRQEIETEMNLCRMKDTVSKGYKGKILEEVLGKIDKYIQKPQEKWIDEDDNRYICKECEYAHKPQKEPCGDAISRQAVLKIIDGWYEQNRDTENIEDLIVLITYMDSVRPQEPQESEVKE